jgi:hypothetical protein
VAKATRDVLEREGEWNRRNGLWTGRAGVEAGVDLPTVHKAEVVTWKRLPQIGSLGPVHVMCRNDPMFRSFYFVRWCGNDLQPALAWESRPMSTLRQLAICACA